MSNMSTAKPPNWAFRYVVFPTALVGLAFGLVLILSAIGPAWVDDNAITLVVGAYAMYVAYEIYVAVSKTS